MEKLLVKWAPEQEVYISWMFYRKYISYIMIGNIGDLKFV